MSRQFRDEAILERKELGGEQMVTLSTINHFGSLLNHLTGGNKKIMAAFGRLKNVFVKELQESAFGKPDIDEGKYHIFRENSDRAIIAKCSSRRLRRQRYRKLGRPIGLQGFRLSDVSIPTKGADPQQ